MSLYKKAKERDQKHLIIEDEHIDLIVAYLRGDVTLTGTAHALGYQYVTMGVYVDIARIMRYAVTSGKIEL